MTDSDDEQIIRLRRVVARISRQLDREAGSRGITRTQWSILLTLAKHGPIGASELAEREGVNPTMLSRTLTKLEEEGLVRRTPGQEDRRAVRVEITPAGAKLHRKVSSERAKLLAERLDRLPPVQAKQLLAALPALEALADEMTQEAVRA
jgi:DNA-binding MarR family transcriptional regulator